MFEMNVLDYLYFLVSQGRFVTPWTIFFHDNEGIDFPYGNLFRFFFTYSTVCHSKHLTDKNKQCPNNIRVELIYKYFSCSSQALTRFKDSYFLCESVINKKKEKRVCVYFKNMKINSNTAFFVSVTSCAFIA